MDDPGQTQAETPMRHPGVDTTPGEMARAGPYLTTGELKLPVND